ncbi:ABC transporter permease [Pseudonocardia cypriaca]|uniref:Transport permease protein n=1 Tax=Pseudonocardia cypriaca TaxID=882449 RepID=A0A543FTN4_9PSEU|nr:ABC transporter permease [Pseudonocardia cypriaca]TQM37186.1 ABC-2 type transport system permease protein [Pseudonocardia cypriaca]
MTTTTTATLALRDCATMLRRQLRHVQRYPSLTLMLAGMPVVFLLLFVYVLGGTLGAGLGGDRGDYATYVAPGILLMTVGTAVSGTSVAVAMDMTEGIVARFRTMAIFRPSVLTGHVLGSMLQTMLSVGVVAVVAVLVGFRPAAGVGGWLAALGTIAAFAFALIWLGVALGMSARSVETASNTPMPLMLLPFLGSGFVPTDSMPPALRWFAEHQPFTPVIETVRGLLMGTPVGGAAIAALAWSAAIVAGSYLWAIRRYNHI